MTTSTVLLFDLGGVLIENDVFTDLPRLLSKPIDRASLQDRWLNSRAVRDFERGRTTPGVFATTFIEEWNLDLSPEEFIDRFSSWPKGPLFAAPSIFSMPYDNVILLPT